MDHTHTLTQPCKRRPFHIDAHMGSEDFKLSGLRQGFKMEKAQQR